MLAQRITEAMEKAGLKQADIARLTGLSTSSVSLIVHGKRVPEKTSLMAIAKACHVNYSWLATGEPPISNDHDPSEEPDIIGQLSAEYGLDEKSKILIEAFLSLPSQYREGVVRYAESLAERLRDVDRREEEDLEAKAEALKQSFLDQQRGMKESSGSFTGNTDMGVKSNA